MVILFPVKKSLGCHFFVPLIKSSKIETKLWQNFRTLQLTETCSKFTIKKSENFVNLFKFNNNGTCITRKSQNVYQSLNPFLANVTIFYPLKTPENLWFSYVFRGCKMRALVRNGLAYSPKTQTQQKPVTIVFTAFSSASKLF